MAATNPALARFAAALVRLREASGLSRYRLAKLAGVTQMNLGRLERGRQDPQLTTLLRLADALGCTLDDLGGRTPGQ